MVSDAARASRGQKPAPIVPPTVSVVAHLALILVVTGIAILLPRNTGETVLQRAQVGLWATVAVLFAVQGTFAFRRKRRALTGGFVALTLAALVQAGGLTVASAPHAMTYEIVAILLFLGGIVPIALDLWTQRGRT